MKTLEERIDELRIKAIQKGVLKTTADQIIYWVAYGIPPGNFVNSVLKNELFQTFSYADSLNIETLKDTISFLYNDCPSGCWGTSYRLEYWTPWEKKLNG